MWWVTKPRLAMPTVGVRERKNTEGENGKQEKGGQENFRLRQQKKNFLEARRLLETNGNRPNVQKMEEQEVKP